MEICWLFAKHGHAPENTRRDSEVIEEREARGSHDSDRLEEQHVERGIYRHGGSQRPELGWIGRRKDHSLPKQQKNNERHKRSTEKGTRCHGKRVGSGRTQVLGEIVRGRKHDRCPQRQKKPSPGALSEHRRLRDNDHGDPDDPQEHANKHVAAHGFDSKHRTDEQGQDR